MLKSLRQRIVISVMGLCFLIAVTYDLPEPTKTVLRFVYVLAMMLF